MNLLFERGDPQAPAGHALIYWRDGSGNVLATYVSVPPIKFDIAKFVPPFLAQMTQGIDLSDALLVPPMPPIPEQVESHEYLAALAEYRRDDLIFAGQIIIDTPASLTGEMQEAVARYAEMYNSCVGNLDVPAAASREIASEASPFADMDERERLNELTHLAGRYLDSVAAGTPDAAIEDQMRQLANVLPRKYRVEEMIEALHEPGERGQRLAQLYMERSYKLFNEDYLDLERLDREIEAALHG